MLFDTKKRYSGSNIALIGYTNGVDVDYTEVQGDYRPDKREQNAGDLVIFPPNVNITYFKGFDFSYQRRWVFFCKWNKCSFSVLRRCTHFETTSRQCRLICVHSISDNRLTTHVSTFVTGGLKGQYYYHVSSNTQGSVASARARCAAWYKKEIQNPWSPGSEPCPCTRLQALIDRRFTISVDYWLWLSNRYSQYYPSYYRSADTTEWSYDQGEIIDENKSLYFK